MHSSTKHLIPGNNNHNRHYSSQESFGLIALPKSWLLEQEQHFLGRYLQTCSSTLCYTVVCFGLKSVVNIPSIIVKATEGEWQCIAWVNIEYYAWHAWQLLWTCLLFSILSIFSVNARFLWMCYWYRWFLGNFGCARGFLIFTQVLRFCTNICHSLHKLKAPGFSVRGNIRIWRKPSFPHLDSWMRSCAMNRGVDLCHCHGLVLARMFNSLFFFYRLQGKRGIK
jgi:hypothetical protein